MFSDGEKRMRIEEFDPAQLSTFRWDIVKREPGFGEKIKRSIERRGLGEPLKIREMPLGKEVWDGVHKLLAIRELGLDRVSGINYGRMTDNAVRASRVALAVQRAEEINRQCLYEEWYRLYSEEEMAYDEISDLYGFPKNDIYQGISHWIKDHGEKKKKEERSKQSTLETFDSLSSEKDTEEKRAPQNFEQARKSINTSRRNLVNKKPREIEIMISGRLCQALSDDIQGSGLTIPSKIVEILNLYYEID